MFVFFPPKVDKWKIYFYSGVIVSYSALCLLFGYLSDYPTESVHTFEPELCFFKPANGTQSPWSFDPNVTRVASDEYVDCNRSLRSVDTSNMSEYLVEFSYPFSLDNETMLDADWIRELDALIVFPQDYEVPFDDPTLDFEAEIMFFDETSSDSKWKSLASTKQKRQIECAFKTLFNEYIYGCTMIHLFKLPAVEHDKYQLNIRFRGRSSKSITYISEMNHLSDMHLMLRHEDPGFTRDIADLKTCILPIMSFAHLAYYQKKRPMETLMEVNLWFHSFIAVLVNIPYEYIFKWTQCALWDHMTAMTEVSFQLSLFCVWMHFMHFLSHDGKSPCKNSHYVPVLLVMLVWNSLAAYDEYFRFALEANPFSGPWSNNITAFKELAVYDFLRSLVALLSGFFVVYQFYTKFNNCFMKKSVLIMRCTLNGWLDISERAQMFTMCLFGCVALAILRFSQNLLRNMHWKANHEDTLVNYLLTPGLFTLFLGLANMLTLTLLGVLPKLRLNIDYKNFRLQNCKFFKSMDAFNDHVTYCCLHSQERLSFCHLLQQKVDPGTKRHYGKCCLRPRQVDPEENMIIHVGPEKNFIPDEPHMLAGLDMDVSLSYVNSNPASRKCETQEVDKFELTVLSDR